MPLCALVTRIRLAAPTLLVPPRWGLLWLPLAVGCSSGSNAGSPAEDGGPEAAAEADATGPRVDASASGGPDASEAGDGGNVDAGGASSDAGKTGDASRDAEPLDPCAGGTVGLSSDAGSSTTMTSGYGSVNVASPAAIPIVGLTTTLHVPVTPPASGTLFLWPGLQPSPSGANYNPISNGVLQPVLTWGPTCAPNAPSSPYASWWVSAQYVNTVGSDPGFTGCQGGAGMSVAVGDALTMTMTLAGTVWSQKVTDQQTGQSVSFDFDLKGQSQNYAEFIIEGYSQEPTVPVQFTSTVITFSAPAAASCVPLQRGATDSFSPPEASPDGTRCCIDAITLKPQGI